jgi:RNA polymerase sigma-70 factor (ECF subfamily)
MTQGVGARPETRPQDEERRIRERQRVKEAQEGNVAAYEELYRDNVGRVYGLCLRLAGNATLAEELTQDVFVRAWQKIGAFRGDSAFSTWLYPIAVNTALSERRSRARRTSRFLATDDLEAFEKPERKPQATPALGLDIERALDELPEGARAIFVLHDIEGFKHEEIAERTGIATGTSKAQLHRARKLLREALGR